MLNENHPDLALRHGDEWLDAWIFVIGRKSVKSVLVGGQKVVEGGCHILQREIEARYRAVAEGILCKLTQRGFAASSGPQSTPPG
jgi:hypothetical protein